MLAAWILFKTQLDIIESMVRSLTDIVWTGSHRARALSRGDVRVVYYGAWGSCACGASSRCGWRSPSCC